MHILDAWLIHITALDTHHLFQLRLHLTQLQPRAKANLRGGSVPGAYVTNIRTPSVKISKITWPSYTGCLQCVGALVRWCVEYMVGIEKDVWGIWLTERDISDDSYLSSTFETRKIKSSAQIVRKDTLVVVEYEHIYHALNFRNGLLGSMLYLCSNQEGGMHKRRHVILVIADAWGVKVVPVTSVELEGNTINLHRN